MINTANHFGRICEERQDQTLKKNKRKRKNHTHIHINKSKQFVVADIKSTMTHFMAI